MRPLFRLDRVSMDSPAVDRWFEDHTGPLGDPAHHWFRAMRQCGNDVMVTLHDGQPTACVEDAAFAYVDAFTSHMNVGFFQGARGGRSPDRYGIHGNGSCGLPENSHSG